jgi:hypothetical protein
METQLEIIVQRLYKIFQPYKLRKNFRERCCFEVIHPDDIKMLYTEPLHMLSVKDIEEYLCGAMRDLGNVEDFKYFLPRILDLIQHTDNYLEEYLLTNKVLELAAWKRWKTTEIKAIENYFIAVWKNRVNNENNSFEKIYDLLLVMITYIGWEQTLSIWERSENTNWMHDIVDMIIANDYHKFNEEIIEHLMHWLSSETMLEKLEKLFFETSDNHISIVHTILKNQ